MQDKEVKDDLQSPEGSGASEVWLLMIWWDGLVGVVDPGGKVTIHRKEVFSGVVVLDAAPKVGPVGWGCGVECVEPLQGVVPLVAVGMGALSCDKV